MTADPTEVDARTAARWLAQGQAVLIDVREAPESAAERITGAVLLPLSHFDPAQAPAAPGQRLIVHCHLGVRSRLACARLRASGRDQVWNLTGGIESWKQAGLPTQRGR